MTTPLSPLQWLRYAALEKAMMIQHTAASPTEVANAIVADAEIFYTYLVTGALITQGPVPTDVPDRPAPKTNVRRRSRS